MENKRYRENGAIGALLDEYEKAIEEIKNVIKDIKNNDLLEIVDNKTTDEDCRSIQTILTHVVRAGYTYLIEIKKWLGEDIPYKEKELLPTSHNYCIALDQMFSYYEKLFDDYQNIKLEEHKSNKKINVKWGQQYDVEQLFEHAIVHILRHRRQIERFMLILEGRAILKKGKQQLE